MTMNRLVLATMTAVLTCVAACVPKLPPPPKPSESLDARELWEKMIAAKGGRQRLHEVTTLVINVDGKQSRAMHAGWTKGEIHETTLLAFPNRYWQWVDTRPRRANWFEVSVYNGDSRQLWWAFGGQDAHLRADAAELEVVVIKFEALKYLLETRYIQPKPLRAGLDPKRQLAVIDLEAPDFVRLRYTVDILTYLPTEFTASWRLPSAGAERVEDVVAGAAFLAYATVDGLQMPSRLFGDRSEVSFIINPAVHPGLFETPPNSVTDREAWKRFPHK